MFTPQEKKAIIVLCLLLLLGGVLRLVRFNEKIEYADQKEERLLININSNNLNELIKLPGVGEKTAKKIFEYRKKFGDFSSFSDLKNVKGLGDKKVANMKDFIVF